MIGGGAGTEEALKRVGEVLAAGGDRCAVVIVGGAALNLRGVVDRPTRDVDIMAFGDPADVPTGLVAPPDSLPAPLLRAAALVAADLGLEDNWLNTGPALQWRQGLPAGFADRVEWRRFGGLVVGVAGLRDLIFLKLYAAADAVGPASVHYRDLVALAPTDADLSLAAEWVRAQDPSPDFHRVLDKVLEHVRSDTRRNRA